jgi:hypothetical protein
MGAPTRKRTDQVTLERVYRKVLAVEREVKSLRETMAPVVGHCERLMREKETLRKLNDANNFMAAPVLTEAIKRPVMSFSDLPPQSWLITTCECSAVKTHRMGVLCQTCGETPS